MQKNNFNIDLLVDIISDDRRNKYVRKHVCFERNNKNIIQTQVTDNNEIESDLRGKTVLAFDTKKQYIVDKVCKQWHKGYYIVLALVDENKSHRIIFWKNINSQDEIIIKSIVESEFILQFI